MMSRVKNCNNLEQKKAELQQLVKKWAAYKAVVEAIKQIMSQLKEEKLTGSFRKCAKLFSHVNRKSI